MTSPELSVILLVPETYESVKKTIAHLQKQTAANKIEIVLVSANGLASSEVEQDMNVFASFRIVSRKFESIGSGYATGIMNCAAPILALAEDHSFPEPEWAEALIGAHAQRAAVIGPAVKNANPGSLVSWADLLIAYSPWLAPAEPREMDHLPGHNSSYKKEVLQEYAAELPSLFEAETVLHWRLRQRGHVLRLEPRAITRHTNFEGFGEWTAAQFYSGRQFAASRAAAGKWLFRRLVYAGASPLIPLVRFARIANAVNRNQRKALPWWRCVPVVLFGLIVDGVGQFCGYILGEGNSHSKLRELEFDRNAPRRQPS